MDVFLLMGIVGMCMLLFAFLMRQRHKMSEDDTRYDAINAVGGLLLVIYGIETQAWPFVILNAVWCLYSFGDVITDLRRKRL